MFRSIPAIIIMQLSTSSYLLSFGSKIIFIDMFTKTLREGNQVSHSRKVRNKIMICLFQILYF